MHALKNKVQLIGWIPNAPEVKCTESGRKLACFSVGTSDSYRNARGERVTETQWHRVIAWGKLATIVEKYLLKGQEVMIEGRLVNRNFTDKDGSKRSVTEIQASELLMLGVKTSDKNFS